MRRLGLGVYRFSSDGTFVAIAAYMAAELTLPRTTGRKTTRTLTVYREGMRTGLRRKAGICCKVGAVLITAVCATFALFINNSYSSFAQLIDQQIAGGYLRLSLIHI